MHGTCIRRALALAAITAAACGVPRDPKDTLERVRVTGVLRAGAVVHPPFVVPSGDGVAGPEVAFVEAFADAHGAEVTWVVGPEQELFARLERFQLDLVVGGITKENPHAKKVGTSLPLHEPAPGKEAVVATAPGENRLLLALDRAVHAERDRVARLLREASP